MRFQPLIPELIVSDLVTSERFYCEILGFRREYAREGFLFVSFHGAQLMLEEQKPSYEGSPWLNGTLERPYGRGINLQITVNEIAPILRSLEKHGIAPRMPPTAARYATDEGTCACTEIIIADPDGYLLRFSETV